MDIFLGAVGGAIGGTVASLIVVQFYIWWISR